MKIQLIDSGTGIGKAIILKEWMRIGLSICLLGLPVLLGYFSIQIAEARNAEFAKNSPTPALGDGFDFSRQTPLLQGASKARTALAVGHFTRELAEHSPLSQQKNSWPLSTAFKTSAYHKALATHRDDLPAFFAKYPDVLKKGHIIVLANVIGYAANSYEGKTPHKNGRVIDPASYIHSTIR